MRRITTALVSCQFSRSSSLTFSSPLLTISLISSRSIQSPVREKTDTIVQGLSLMFGGLSLGIFEASYKVINFKTYWSQKWVCVSPESNYSWLAQRSVRADSDPPDLVPGPGGGGPHVGLLQVEWPHRNQLSRLCCPQEGLRCQAPWWSKKVSQKTAKIFLLEADSDPDILPGCASRDLLPVPLGLGHQAHHHGHSGEEAELGHTDSRSWCTVSQKMRQQVTTLHVQGFLEDSRRVSSWHWPCGWSWRESFLWTTFFTSTGGEAAMATTLPPSPSSAPCPPSSPWPPIASGIVSTLDSYNSNVPLYAISVTRCGVMIGM